MDFALNDEQRMMIDTVRRFIRDELQPLEQRVEDEGRLDDDTAHSIIERSRAVGLYALNMPAALGGGGLGAVDSMLCEEQFGHTTDILVRRAFGNVYDALLACEGEQVDRWVRPAIAGTRTCGLAITETGAGSDAQSIKTHAERTPSGWVLNGAKHFISDAGWSDFFLVSARTGDNAISLFAVDKGLPGFTLGKDQSMMGLRGTTHYELFFDDVPLEPMALIGGEGEGFKLAMGMLGRVRLALVGARAVGKASHVLELMTDYAKDRRQFGQRIGDFQLIQQMLADSAMEINAARLMVLHTAWMIDAGLDARDWISMVKVQASETLGRVVDRAVQVFGGMGFCKELPIERYYRDARVYRIFDGTSEIHRGIVARGLLKRGAELFDLHR
ncbi:acyl-CoA dehydrogenase family protein [Variovorax sp. KK3]|uniref:acyl-CoA dehydrogenase family protein n=1 Tax=Variovorax sp. KK3 TaxID=1855728 RepID=UPI00097BF1DF|nr:acyl-CoA dehydrogenase [Variovorax sp. KK3]